MKKTTWPWRLLALGAFCLLLPGCATTGPVQPSLKRFSEGAATDLVVRFNRWDTMFILRPEVRQEGFLPILTRGDLEHRLQGGGCGHALAVVIIGLLFSRDQEAQLAREWDGLLQAHGFRRIVLVRAGSGKNIDGLLVIHDSGIPAVSDQPATATHAAHAVAARADVAYSSGR